MTKNGVDLKNLLTAQQITGPNLVLVEGGTFVMGATEEDLTI
jgi:formylglycine-generating enzyme required for sulfatase activity